MHKQRLMDGRFLEAFLRNALVGTDNETRLYHQELIMRCRSRKGRNHRDIVFQRRLCRGEKGRFRLEGWAPCGTRCGQRKAKSGPRTPMCKFRNRPEHPHSSTDRADWERRHFGEGP